jgi:23S rRNA (guanosine2251-2'-O)-methyltransferase
MKELLFGRNAVYEALRAGRRQAFRLLVAEGAQEKGRLAEILALCASRKLSIERVLRPRLDKVNPGHQGVVLETSGYPYDSIHDLLELARQSTSPPHFLILDTLQDPQNLGTLLRTAEAVGVGGVLLPLKQTATVTPAVVNASSGASEHLSIAQANLAHAIRALQEAEVWVVGLDSSGEALPPEQVHLDGPLALVVGSEGEGMRSLVRKSCDQLLRLPMQGKVGSLNAAVAGSIALYLAWQNRKDISN